MNYKKLDVDLLHAAYVLFRTRSFVSAATELNCTPSAVSHKIRKLEERIGRELFERTTRSVRPTHDGEILAADAAQVLEAMDVVIRHFQEAPISGQIKLGLSEEWLVTPVAELILEVPRLYPGVTVALETAPCERLHARIEDGSVDIAVTLDFNGFKDDDCHQEPLVWVGHPSLFCQGKPIPLVVNPPPCTHRKALLNALKTESVDYDIAVNAGSLDAFRLAVAAGLGLGALPMSALRDDDGVEMVPDSLRLPQLARGKYIVRTAKSSRAPKINWLKAQLEEIVSARSISSDREPFVSQPLSLIK